MFRIVAVVAGLCLAAFAVWHPAPRSSIAFAPERAERHPATNKHRGPAAGSPGLGSVVYVVGAVTRPGLYPIAAGARVDDAVRRAGGFLPSADPAGVNLAQHVADGDEIVVPRLGEPTPAPRRSRKSARRRKPSRTAAPAVAIDLNAADEETLAAVPGIGPSLAARVVELRERDGAFASLDQLLDVAGMTPRRLDLAQAYLYVR